jgi:deoxycytidine triphosphate deaminase
MYLLNRETITRYVHAPRGQCLDIQDFAPSNMDSTHYYFRLGHNYTLFDPKTGDSQMGRLSNRNRTFSLAPLQTVGVWSFERFALTERIMGIFGPPSEFSDEGLLLIHSPFIDPGFEGRLELVIMNLRPDSQTLELEMKIGKIKFFDVSDTYPVPPLGTEDPGRKTTLETRRDFPDASEEWGGVPPEHGDHPHKHDYRRRD